MADIIRLRGEAALPARPVPSGFATLPRRVLRRDDIRAEKITLQAIISLCYYDSKETRASNRDISAVSGIPVRTVQIHVARLCELGLLGRKPDPCRPGGPWITSVLTDPKGFELDDTPRANWRLISEATPRNQLRDPAQPVARPRATSCAGLLIQKDLILTEEVESAPPVRKDAHQPGPVEPYRGPRSPGTPPPGYRWVYSQGNCREGARPGLEPIPGYHDGPDPDDPDGSKQRAAIAAIRAMLPRTAIGKKKPGRGLPVEDAPRPVEVHPRQPAGPESEHSMKARSPQEPARAATDGQRARQDSNLPPDGTGPSG